MFEALVTFVSSHVHCESTASNHPRRSSARQASSRSWPGLQVRPAWIVASPIAACMPFSSTPATFGSSDP